MRLLVSYNVHTYMSNEHEPHCTHCTLQNTGRDQQGVQNISASVT